MGDDLDILYRIMIKVLRFQAYENCDLRTKDSGKLYVTKPIFSNYIIMLYGITLPSFFVVVKS